MYGNVQAYTPWIGLAEMEQDGGSIRQDFNLIILETCCLTKTIQMEKTDHDFFNVVGIGWGDGKLPRKIP